MGELLEATRRYADPPPPEGFWEDFSDQVNERLEQPSGVLHVWRRLGWRVAAVAVILVLGFGLGMAAMRSVDRQRQARLAASENRLELLRAELRNEARLESYVGEIEELLVAYRATEHGDAVDVFRQSLPSAMVAGSGVPSEADRRRLEEQRVMREQLRTVVLGMLASEIEAERHGFGYLDRRIAEIAGQRFLYFVR